MPVTLRNDLHGRRRSSQADVLHPFLVGRGRESERSATAAAPSTSVSAAISTAAPSARPTVAEHRSPIGRSTMDPTSEEQLMSGVDRNTMGHG
jgi:hypothetical protein